MSTSAEAGPSHPPGVAAPQWRQFSFFDLEDVRDTEDLASSPKALKSLNPPVLTIPTSPDSPLPTSIIVAAGQSISILDRHFAVLANWVAWEGHGRATHLAEAGGLLVAMGEEDGQRHPVLKIWDLTREEKKRKGGGPVLLRNARIQHGQRPHPVSAVALTSNLSHLAVGLGDGTVLLYRHLLQSLTTSPTTLTSLPRARVIHESPEPVTGLGFREPSFSASSARAPESDKGVSQPTLFITTVNRILSAPVSSRGGDARAIDELGAGLGCAVLNADRKEMIVARDEAIYLYGPEGRGACYAYEGPKSSISIFRHNLVMISPSFTPSAGSNSATVRQYVAKAGDTKDVAKVTVFDLRNKIIAYSGTFKDGVREVFCQWGGIFVYGSKGDLSRLDEHSTQAKLDVLYRRNMYTLAINLAESSGMKAQGVADIHQKYGDHLYAKADYDAAMNQYIQTLGYLQPSYVIRKFLDAQRIQNLIKYLQSLHSRNLANPDHTTLLLNCYTKTGDREALDNFIKTETQRAEEGGGGLDDLPFDLETAIRVCRQAGFYEHASFLSRKYGRHEDFLRVQIEDAQEYGDALRYLRSLGPVACRENLLLYGGTLLHQVPVETTELLIELCSGTLGRPKPAPALEATKANGSNGPAVLTYLGYNLVAGMFTSESQSNGVRPVDAPVEPARVNGESPVDGKGQGSIPHSGDKREADGSQSAATYTPPSPREYFAQFIDHRELFIHFLEAVALGLWGQQVTLPPPTAVKPLPPPENTGNDQKPDVSDQRAVWNTLLELYLASRESSTESVSSLAQQKASGLILSDLPYDNMHALLLCYTANFTQGTIKLWERMGMYEDILRYYMDSEAEEGAPHPSDQVLRYLGLYGEANPQLYPLVLRYLTSSPEVVSRQASQLGAVLEKIDEMRIMPPLAVVQLLSRNGVASVGNVKAWLRSKVEETKQDVESDKSLVQSYRNEASTKSSQITSLANPAQPEIFQVTRCASCGQQLDLPTVHFMCKHSYHQRCLSDADPECILCARQHAVIREVRRNQTRLADRHDMFLAEVEEADDGFAVVAGGFGRGLMNLRVDT